MKISKELKMEIVETFKWTDVLVVFTCWPVIASIILHFVG